MPGIVSTSYIYNDFNEKIAHIQDTIATAIADKYKNFNEKITSIQNTIANEDRQYIYLTNTVSSVALSALINTYRLDLTALHIGFYLTGSYAIVAANARGHGKPTQDAIFEPVRLCGKFYGTIQRLLYKEESKSAQKEKQEEPSSPSSLFGRILTSTGQWLFSEIGATLKGSYDFFKDSGGNPQAIATGLAAAEIPLLAMTINLEDPSLGWKDLSFWITTSVAASVTFAQIFKQLPPVRKALPPQEDNRG